MSEEMKPVFFGPIEQYTVYQQLVHIFSRKGYVVFVKLREDGWTGELRMPVLSEREVEQEES